MSANYTGLKLFLRFGGLLAPLSGVGVFIAFFGIYLESTRTGYLWIVLGVSTGLVVTLLFLVMRDLVRVISEMLMPAP